MIEPFIHFALSGLVIVVAGTFLVRASDSLAELTKMGRLLAGSIFLAGATSLPELLVDISAIRKNMPDLAAGDLMGSNLMNLIILGCADLFHRSSRKMLSRAGARHALSAAMSINLFAVAAIAILLGPQLRDWSVSEIGIGPLVIGIIYAMGLRLVFISQQSQPDESSKNSSKHPKRELTRALTVYFLCALAIFIAAPFMAGAAGAIAEITGLGTTFVGTTLVAVCTSLPELVSTIAAIRLGAFDLVVGNIFGSNSFNMLLFIPLDWLYVGNLFGAISKSHILTILATIFATSVFVMGQLYQEERRKKFIELDALAVIVIAVGALYILYLLG